MAEDRASGRVCRDVTGQEKAPGMEEGLRGAQTVPGEDGLRKNRKELGLRDGRGLGETRRGERRGQLGQVKGGTRREDMGCGRVDVPCQCDCGVS